MSSSKTITATFGAAPSHLRWDTLALLVSGVAALFAPLQTFLLAYLLLGPLHYLTEMAWLRRKDFYFEGGAVGPSIFASGAGVLAVLATLFVHSSRGFAAVLAIVTVAALSVWLRSVWALVAVALAALAAVEWLPGAWAVFALLLPTLVHVFAFTLIFMVSGAMRARSRWAALNCLLMATIALALVVVRMPYAATGTLWLGYERDTFAALHGSLAHALGRTLHVDSGLLADPVVAAMMRLFGFAYLFHYLNWFAKTELLAWHRMSRRGWAVVALVMVLLLAMYAVNFRIGFVAVSALALLHVVLELPLNVHSIRHVSRWRRASLRPSAQS